MKNCTSFFIGVFLSGSLATAQQAGRLKPLEFESFGGAKPAANSASSSAVANVGQTTSRQGSSTEAQVAAVRALPQNVKIHDVPKSIKVFTMDSLTINQPSKKTPQRLSENDGAFSIKIAAGSEKREWLSAAYELFMKRKMNIVRAADSRGNIGDRTFDINIVYTGSVASGDEIALGDSDYTVWSPASSMFRGIVSEAYAGSVFESEDPLVYSPLVHLIFQDTIDKMTKLGIKEINFVTLAKFYRDEQHDNRSHLYEDETKMFKYATTSGDSNSALTSLFMMAYDYFANRNQRLQILSEGNLNDAEFQGFLSYLKSRLVTPSSSTGTLGVKMANFSNSGGREFEGALIYENLAVTRVLKQLGANNVKARIVYPKYSLMTDHPYYIITHKTTPSQRLAAAKFRDFLLSKEVQTIAVEQFGFRPSSDQVSAKAQTKAFADFVKSGLAQDLDTSTNFINPPTPRTIRLLRELYRNLESVD